MFFCVVKVAFTALFDLFARNIFLPRNFFFSFFKLFSFFCAWAVFFTKNLIITK